MQRQKRFEVLFDLIARTLLKLDPGDLVQVSDLSDALHELSLLSPWPERTQTCLDLLIRGVNRWMRGQGHPDFPLLLTQGVDLLATCYRQIDTFTDGDFPDYFQEAFDGLQFRLEALHGPPDTPSEPSPPVAAPVPPAASPEVDAHQREVLATFLHESFDRLQRAQDLLLTLEEDARPETINELFRIYHTIKGEAGFLRFPALGRLTHALETLLDRIRQGTIPVCRSLVDDVLASMDLLQEILQDIRAGGTEGGQHGPRVNQTIAKLESLNTGCLDHDRPSPSGGEPPPRKTPMASDTGEQLVSVKASQIQYLIDMVGELLINLNQLDEQDKLVQTAKKTTRSIQGAAMKLGTTKVASLLGTIRRTARDAAQVSGKDFQVNLQGDEIEVDRTLVERLGEPLMHLVRNSVVHGLEADPAERTARGKAARGSITVSVERRGHQVVVAVEDDGQGIDTARVRAKALEKGLVPEAELAAMDEQEVHDLVFLPGFSTAAQVDALAGRGVGMDVVKTMVQNLRGRLALTSTRHRGTRVELTFPINMAIIDGMLVSLGSLLCVVPVVNIVESIEVSEGMSHQVRPGIQVLNLRGQTLPVIDLHAWFGLTAPSDPEARRLALVVESGPRRYACLISGIIAKKEVVIKPLSPLFSHVRGIAGGTILHGGRIGLVLDIDRIIAG